MGCCTWAGMNEADRIYHDNEWGIPVHDDRRIFDHLTLECLQCPLPLWPQQEIQEVLWEEIGHVLKT